MPDLRVQLPFPFRAPRKHVLLNDFARLYKGVCTSIASHHQLTCLKGAKSAYWRKRALFSRHRSSSFFFSPSIALPLFQIASTHAYCAGALTHCAWRKRVSWCPFLCFFAEACSILRPTLFSSLYNPHCVLHMTFSKAATHLLVSYFRTCRASTLFFFFDCLHSFSLCSSTDNCVVESYCFTSLLFTATLCSSFHFSSAFFSFFLCF